MQSCWKTITAVLAVSLAVTACGTGGANVQNNGNAGASQNNLPDGVQPLSLGGGYGMLANIAQQPVRIPYVAHGNKKYVPLDTIVELLEYEKYETEEDGSREIGDKDVLFRLTPDSLDALNGGDPVRLAEAPKVIDGKMMITPSTAADLFAEDMVFDVGENELIVYPSNTTIIGRDNDDSDFAVDESLDFADDPNDPFKGDEDEGVFFNSPDEAEAALEALEAVANDPEAQAVLKNINMNRLISTAKQYLGVRYDFGAKPYPRSNAFDCSSYTQYVYGKFGINLPRTARAQGRMGQTVSRKNLRKGDLLFFYVPGRFKSNKVVGHVGIYIGNRKMIHANTEPKDGVQIRSIDRAFWKKTFIKAKRIAY